MLLFLKVYFRFLENTLVYTAHSQIHTGNSHGLATNRPSTDTADTEDFHISCFTVNVDSHVDIILIDISLRLGLRNKQANDV